MACASMAALGYHPAVHPLNARSQTLEACWRLLASGNFSRADISTAFRAL